MAVQTEDLQYQLSRFEDWVKNTDVKIGVILAFDGVILATIVKHALNIIFDPKIPSFMMTGYIIVLLLLLCSIGKALWAVFPRLKHHQGKLSLLYFSDVSKIELREYKRKLATLSMPKYRDEVIAQIHAIAKIAEKRMSSFRDSVQLLAISLLIAGGVEVWLRLINL